jgi:hypothetical protein
MLFLILLLAATGSLPGPAPVRAAPLPLAYLGTDTATGGSWIGKYGSEGYVLFGYNAAPNGSTQYVAASANAVSLPPYVNSYSYSIAGNVQVWPAYDSDARILEPLSPAGGRFRAEAAGYNDKTYTFLLNDSAEHVFSFYSMNNSADASVRLLDLSGNAMDERLIAKTDFGLGAYVTYTVKGSFQLLITTGGTRWGLSGFFFDGMLADRPGSAAAVPSGRDIGLTWTNPGFYSQVIVERSQDDIRYEAVASLPGSAVSYLDEDLLPSTVYHYRLRYKEGTLFGRATDTVSAATVNYTDTLLSFQHGDVTAVAGDTELLTVKFETVAAGVYAPVAGKTVTFTLAGPFVGTMIFPALGTDVTDAAGLATVSYPADYGGEYTVTAHVETDDADQLDPASDIIALEVQPAPWLLPPQVFQTSEAVAPNQLLSLYGGGLDPASLSVWIEPLAGSSVPASPTPAAVELAPVQTESGGDRFARIVVPEEWAAGVYALWAENSHGLSDTVVVNAADPRWLSGAAAFEGLKVRLVGRNLDAAEFGGVTATSVRLVDTAALSVVSAAVESVSPYAVDFDVAGAPLGEYYVEVRNGVNVPWVRLPGGTLAVTAAGANPDPLGLGVAWAKDFAWANQFDAQTDYGAAGNGITDDRPALQAAIDDIANNGGGVLYFPSGTYRIGSGLQLRSGVVLLGEDNADTTLAYHGTGGNMIGVKSDGVSAGLLGISNLNMTVNEANLTSTLSLFTLGHSFGTPLANLSATRIFIDRTVADLSLNNKKLGIGAAIGARQQVLISNNQWTGFKTGSIYSPFIYRELVIRGNELQNSDSSAINITAQQSIIENNHLTGHFIPGVTVGSFRGLKADSGSRGWNAERQYWVGNTVDGYGSDESAAEGNDGETILIEAVGSVFSLGQVLKATPNTATLGRMFSEAGKGWDQAWQIAVTDGKGLGQIRRVISQANETVTIDRAWDIVPDSTSKFTLARFANDVVWAGNSTSDSRGGLQIYHNVHDAVIADNALENTHGISVWGRASGGGQGAPSYFIQVRRNEVAGGSWKFNTSWVGVSASQINLNSYTDAFMTVVYGAEFRGNTVNRDGFSGIGDKLVRNVPAAMPIAFREPGTAIGGKGVLAALMEGNSLSHSDVGFYFSFGVDGSLLRGNLYNDVDEEVRDGGTNTLLLP